MSIVQFYKIFYGDNFERCKMHRMKKERFQLITYQETIDYHLNGLHTANLSWQTRVGKPKLVCVNGIKTVGKHVSI